MKQANQEFLIHMERKLREKKGQSGQGRKELQPYLASTPMRVEPYVSIFADQSLHTHSSMSFGCMGVENRSEKLAHSETL